HALAIVTALVAAGTIQRPTVLYLILLYRQLGSNVLDFDAVALLDALPCLKGFPKLIACVDVENAHPRLDGRQHMDDAIAFRPKRGGHRQAGEESSHGPA